MTLSSNSTSVKSWRAHLIATASLGFPLIGAQLAQMAINTTDVVMLGWLGTEELAAGVLATQIFFVLYIFGTGFATAVMPLVAQAEGQNDIRGVRRAVRMGIWIALFYSIITLPPLWFIEDILLMLGQDANVSALAKDYMQVAMWAMAPALVAHCMRSFLSAMERAQIVLWAVLLGTLTNAFLNYALIFGNFGAPALGIVGAAIASLITNVLISAILIFYTTWLRQLKKYDLFVRLWRSDWEAFGEILRLGWPIGIAIISEVGMFTIASIFMGWLGTVQLAAHGIVMQIAALAFMIPLGLSSAATVRVGRTLARNEVQDMRRAAVTVTAMALLFSSMAAILFLVLPVQLVDLFLDYNNPLASQVAAYAVPLLFIVAAFQLVDCLQVVAGGMLRGMKDTKVPMVIAVVSYWGLGISSAYVLGLHTDLAGVGIWMGLAIGLAAAALFMNIRFWRSAHKIGLAP